MNAKRAFYLMLGGLGVSFIALIGVVYFGNKMLLKESDKLVELKAVSQVLEQQTTGLSQAQQDVQKYKGIEEITQAVVPQDKDQARAVREVVSLASISGIQLESITFPASNLGTSTQPKAQGDGAQAAPPPTLSQAKPVQGIKGVYSLELTIKPTDAVDYYKFIDFISRLEKNRRTSQVSRISIGQPEDKTSGNIDFSLTVNIFVKP